MPELDQLFQLTDGRYIMDTAQSARMQKIKEATPERGSPMSGIGYAWDEAGVAELFALCYDENTRYCPERKSWYTYDNGVWRKDTGALLVAERIKELCRLLALYTGEILDDERRNAYMKFVATIGDRRFRDRVMKDAASAMPIAAANFDANPNLINCKNGTYDLEKMEFRPHRWDDFLTLQSNVEYTLQDVSCPRWEQFMKEVTCNDASKAEYIQKALGYSMLGSAHEECMFILHGKTTRNGKSTMLNAIYNLLGDYAAVVPVSIICRQPKAIRNAESATPILASLQGIRFVTMAESNQDGRLDEEVIKQFTGGEAITARALYEAQITYKPQFTMWLSCNDLPAVSDKSLFSSNRLRVITFDRHFTPDEQDKNLKQEFEAPEAMRGIFAWLIAGYFKYKRFGLDMPLHMAKNVQKYAKDNDVVLQFLTEKCESATGNAVRAKTLYDVYKIWCKSNGYTVYSYKRFTAGVDEHPELHGGAMPINGVPHYIGLRLKG